MARPELFFHGGPAAGSYPQLTGIYGVIKSALKSERMVDKEKWTD